MRLSRVPAVVLLGMLQCSLHEVDATVADYLEAIAAYAAGHPDLDWIQGEGWYMAAFAGGTPRSLTSCLYPALPPAERAICASSSRSVMT